MRCAAEKYFFKSLISLKINTFDSAKNLPLPILYRLCQPLSSPSLFLWSFLDWKENLLIPLKRIWGKFIISALSKITFLKLLREQRITWRIIKSRAKNTIKQFKYVFNLFVPHVKENQFIKSRILKIYIQTWFSFWKGNYLFKINLRLKNRVQFIKKGIYVLWCIHML